jgi:hypothetical protein
MMHLEELERPAFFLCEGSAPYVRLLELIEALCEIEKLDLLLLLFLGQYRKVGSNISLGRRITECSEHAELEEDSISSDLCILQRLEIDRLRPGAISVFQHRRVKLCVRKTIPNPMVKPPIHHRYGERVEVIERSRFICRLTGEEYAQDGDTDWASFMSEPLCVIPAA